MQVIELSLRIFKKDIILKAFEAYKEVADGIIEMNSTNNNVKLTFFTDDIHITKEFSNYLIGLSAIEV